MKPSFIPGIQEHIDVDRVEEEVSDQTRKVADAITHQLALKDWKSGFDLMEQKRAVKILLHP